MTGWSAKKAVTDKQPLPDEFADLDKVLEYADVWYECKRRTNNAAFDQSERDISAALEVLAWERLVVAHRKLMEDRYSLIKAHNQIERDISELLQGGVPVTS